MKFPAYLFFLLQFCLFVSFIRGRVNWLLVSLLLCYMLPHLVIIQKQKGLSSASHSAKISILSLKKIAGAMLRRRHSFKELFHPTTIPHSETCSVVCFFSDLSESCWLEICRIRQNHTPWQVFHGYWWILRVNKLTQEFAVEIDVSAFLPVKV